MIVLSGMPVFECCFPSISGRVGLWYLLVYTGKCKVIRLYVLLSSCSLSFTFVFSPFGAFLGCLMTLVAASHYHHHVFNTVPASRYYCNALRTTNAAVSHKNNRRVSLVKNTRYIQPVRQATPSSTKATRKKTVRFSDTIEHIRLFYQWEAPTTATTISWSQQLNGHKKTVDTNSGLLLSTANAHANEKAVVQLEYFSVQPNQQHQVVTGQCCVVNLAFEKHVIVRYTFDNWRTFVDMDAVYQGPCSSNNSKDCFSFSFVWHDKADENQQVQFALRYIVNGQEFWDNNNGQNYTASLVSKSNPS